MSLWTFNSTSYERWRWKFSKQETQIPAPSPYSNMIGRSTASHDGLLQTDKMLQFDNTGWLLAFGGLRPSGTSNPRIKMSMHICIYEISIGPLRYCQTVKGLSVPRWLEWAVIGERRLTGPRYTWSQKSYLKAQVPFSLKMSPALNVSWARLLKELAETDYINKSA